MLLAMTLVVRWVPNFVAVFVMGLVYMFKSYAEFTPTDNYLLACGSSQNVAFFGKNYSPDSGHDSVSLKSQENSIVATSNSTSPFPIYQSARIFTRVASYKFDIREEGRHWVRLYFYPIPGNNLTSAAITVVTDDFVLLNNVTFKSYNGSYLFKEYAINVTTNSLSITFVPANGSVSFVNAIEVVSIPDNLIPEQAYSPVILKGFLDLLLKLFIV